MQPRGAPPISRPICSLSESNLAHALMFLNRSDEAKDIYLEFRGAPLNGKTWEQVVLEDFTELRKAGLANPLMDVIEKTFAKNE